MTDKETILIGCPICGDIYRWIPGEDTVSGGKGWECLGKLSKEERVALTLQRGQPCMFGWSCIDCQKKRAYPACEETSL